MRKKIKMSYWLVFLLVQVFACEYTVAQNTVQVAIRTVNKEIPYEAGDSLLLKAEKANVTITGWDKDYIKLVLKLISKHPKLEVARAELEYLNFDITKSGRTHKITNYFKSSEGFKKVKGTLLSVYELKVPKSLMIEMQNRYGQSKVKGMQVPLKIDTRFVEIQIKDCVV